MRSPLICLALILVIMLTKNSQACKQLWDNTCVDHNDCCGRNCFKEPGWINGVCKPPGQHPTNHIDNRPCKGLYDNSCTSDDECCSRFCDKPPEWKEGVCKNRQ